MMMVVRMAGVLCLLVLRSVIRMGVTGVAGAYICTSWLAILVRKSAACARRKAIDVTGLPVFVDLEPVTSETIAHITRLENRV